MAIVRAIFSVGALWSDHAVFQAREWTSIHGREWPGGKVELFLDGVFQRSCVAGADGLWALALAPQKAGESHYIRIVGTSGCREIHDIVFGEVWLAAGQSNMEFPLKDSLPGIGNESFPSGIRIFKTPKRLSEIPLDLIEDGGWEICDNNVAADFSAVAYYFAKSLREELDVPVGIILSAWGGTPIQAWISKPGDNLSDGVLDEGEVFCFKNIWNDTDAGNLELKRWENYRNEAYAKVEHLEFATPGFDDADWKRCPVPGNFEEIIGDFDGSVWFRREVEIPEHWKNRDLLLSLGIIDDLDHCYLDGVLIGKTPPEVPEYHLHFRQYVIPAELVDPGRHVLAVRVFDEFMSGGFLSLSREIWIAPVDARPAERISLAGYWRVRVGRAITPRPMIAGMPQMLPGLLFNGMIAPISCYRIAGFLWYQGESDCGNAISYRNSFRFLIREWRARWGQGFLPFHFVQLAGYGRYRNNPECSALADLRQAQADALVLPATGMSTAIDLGDISDLHPKQKREIGFRLARSVLAAVYGRSDTNAYGPRLVSVRREREQVIFLVNTPVGLSGHPAGMPLEFDLIYMSGERIRCPAQISNDHITLDLPANPGKLLREVRHAWASNPQVHIVDSMGTPLPPFCINLIDNESIVARVEN